MALRRHANAPVSSLRPIRVAFAFLARPPVAALHLIAAIFWLVRAIQVEALVANVLVGSYLSFTSTRFYPAHDQLSALGLPALADERRAASGLILGALSIFMFTAAIIVLVIVHAGGL